MTNKRATTIISGDVQDVGYRAIVMRMGQKAGLTGYVENQPDGSVRVICEGDEATIKDFTKKLNIHEDDMDVEDISVEWSDATGEFEWFTVKIIDRDMELFQGFATAGKKLGGIGQKVDVVGQKVDVVGQKVDVVGQKVDGVGKDVRVVGEKIDNLTASTKENFNELGEKYHVISENMVALNKNIEKMVHALTILVKEHIEREKQ